VRYLNVYSVTRHYGGPEEGGWWYDQWEPLAAHVIKDMTPGEIEETREMLKKDYQHIDSKFSRFSAAGGTDIVIREENNWPEPFPKERPHYE
jgi:hypothetical protein